MSPLAANKVLALLSTAFLGVVLIVLVMLAYGFPEPYVHDEFAYLLGADTFLEGRITNPTPPLPEFFETFHVNMEPTYHSKYPPAQSAFLALGKWLFGMEIYGVWLSFVAAAVATVWALLAVFPPRWAVWAGGLSLFNHTLLLKWAFSFWGGAVAMLGGALLMGGLLRLYKRPSVSPALGACSGLFLLAFSRPLEGLITAGLLLSFFLATLWMRRKTHPPSSSLYAVLGLFALTGIVVLVLNLAYNHSLTGSALLFPHSHWSPAESSHELIRAYRGSRATTFLYRLGRLFSVFFGPFLWLPALFALRRFRDPRILAVTTTTLFLFLYTSATGKAWPHYAAPMAPFVFGLIVAGCLTLSRWKVQQRPVGLLLTGLLLILHFGFHTHTFLSRARTIHFDQSREQGAVFKRDLDRFLDTQPGRHLILIRYLEGHSLHWEYLYNRADLSSAKVIWAREMEPEQNQRLFEAFPDRKLWLLKLRNFPVEFTPLSQNPSPGPSPSPDSE